VTDQPMPKQGGGRAVTPLALGLFQTMLREREMKGVATYGRSLHTENGRDPLQDLLEELIDGWQYAVQARMERDELHATLARWLRARDAAPVMVDDVNRVTYRDSRDYESATDALERLARKVVSNG
jgi:hypothetical protein